MARLSNLFFDALQHHQAGRLAEAERGYREVLAHDPRHADSLHLLGVIARHSGRHADAIALISQAIGLRGDVALYHNNLADALHAEGRLADAAAAYRRALQCDPAFAAIHRNLADVLVELDELHDAAAHYRQAIALRPDFGQAHNNLGCVLQRLNQLAAAEEYFRRALELSPDDAGMHANLGNVLAEQDRMAAAVPEYRRSIALRPEVARTHNDLGCALRDLGDLAEAARAFEQAIALQPRSGDFYRNLFHLRRTTAADPYFAAMQALAQDMDALPVDDRKELHFALGKAYADLGEHERGFRHLLEGNALARQGFVYDEAETLRLFDRIQAAFSAGLMRARQGSGDPSSLPVFIVGMPRSGTTLVEQILASHPRVFAGGERAEFPRLGGALRVARDPGLAFPEAIAGASDSELRQLGARYLAALPGLASGALRITDKMPGNSSFAGLIRLALPGARLIHVTRDPVDTCLSCFATLFASWQPFSYDLAELGRYYRGYARLMAYWRAVLPPGAMLEVRYEDVVADLAGQARRIVAYCGLAWDDACLAFHLARRPVRTVSAVQVRQPIYSSSVGRWRAYERLLRPLIAELDAIGGDGTAAADPPAAAPRGAARSGATVSTA